MPRRGRVSALLTYFTNQRMDAETSTAAVVIVDMLHPLQPFFALLRH